jgi:hypothetical protein
MTGYCTICLRFTVDIFLQLQLIFFTALIQIYFDLISFSPHPIPILMNGKISQQKDISIIYQVLGQL